jgi:hypothetical protein
MLNIGSGELAPQNLRVFVICFHSHKSLLGEKKYQRNAFLRLKFVRDKIE